ncbi:MAG: family 20 glycosylhydrolase [Bacteroidetes bacterium]|nr:family 20 glycosylhydrolase [Bacteroidota bacterium]
MYKKSFELLFFFSLVCIIAVKAPAQNETTIIPKPFSLKMKPGTFEFNRGTTFYIHSVDKETGPVAGFIKQLLEKAGLTGLNVLEEPADIRNIKNAVVFRLTNKGKIPAEGYILTVSPEQIIVEAPCGSGLFYGMQSLIQLFPPEVYSGKNGSESLKLSIPCIEIKDHPRFAYRGMHLDVSRHFFPKEFIKQYIDLIAMYKMNVFHWHLTDDNGWRIEIKKYPKLTSIGAWRVDHENEPWDTRARQKPGETATYGGFYSQDEIREIVQYAASRYVTIIPEIEMPAHSVEVLAAYPELSCTGGPFTVPPGTYWPNKDILCAGNDSVFTFLENVLTEVMELFPSRYIHIGGDEADKTNWKTCKKCQDRIKAEGLKDEKELQSYFIKRIEKFILSKNRRLIGWDEILDGGIAPEATVMSWRGVEGGIAAARQGHDAIMTPGDYCYFDHYQADPETEPKAIGGFLTLKKVYSYEPVPEELTQDEQKHILGAQGNVWTEFIPSVKQVEYMALPRMIALAEVDWSPKTARNFVEFRTRLNVHLKKLDFMKVTYSPGSFKADINTLFDKKTGKVKVVLSSEQPGFPIYYTLDGKNPSTKSAVYTDPIDISGTVVIKAGIFSDGKLKEKLSERNFLFHFAVGKKIIYKTKCSERYPAGGQTALIDGLRGSKDHHDGLWQGYLGNDLDVIIDFGKDIPVTSVMLTMLQNQKAWIFLPKFVEYSLSSDGKKWHSVNQVLNTVSPKEETAFIQPFTQAFPATPARYLRVTAKNYGVCPAWHEGAGEPSWIFADEIVVY